MASQDKGAESPTTAQPLDFDDDNQETGTLPESVSSPERPPRTSSQQQVPQVKSPTRGAESTPKQTTQPKDAQAEAEQTLVEAFPGIDPKVVKAVLTASGGQLEPSFNALLSMSDPNYKPEQPPAQPPRPTQGQTQNQQQVDADAMYARQLAEHYQAQSHAASRQRAQGRVQSPTFDQEERAARQQSGYQERNFFDDDLPEFRENMRQGFLQTQTKVNRWISDFKKRMEAPSDDEEERPPVPGRPGQPLAQRGPIQGAARRSTDHDRYDADPQLLSDNFTELELHDDEAPPQKPSRPQANPDLFKPTPAAPQSGPVDEVEGLYQKPGGSSANRQPSPSSGGKSKKWQPMTSVAPAPSEDDNDPFSLGDSDDDKEAKSKDVKAADTERLKNAASIASPREDAEAPRKSLEPSERSGSVGTRNKEAEELMKGEGEKKS